MEWYVKGYIGELLHWLLGLEERRNYRLEFRFIHTWIGRTSLGET